MEIKQVLVAAVEIGECLLVSGGGVSRVEDTIGRICRAYGARETDVFSITSSIVASVRDEDGEVYTRTKRIREYHTDFYKLDQLNQLSRYICENQPELSEIRERLERIRQGDGQTLVRRSLISAVIAAAFAAFFGGSWQESLTAFCIGGLVMLFREYMNRFSINRMFLDFVSAFLVATMSAVGSPVFPAISRSMPPGRCRCPIPMCPCSTSMHRSWLGRRLQMPALSCPP